MSANLFELGINLGNAAMESYADVAAALRNAANKVGQGSNSGSLMGDNGNKVGSYRFRRR